MSEAPETPASVDTGELLKIVAKQNEQISKLMAHLDRATEMLTAGRMSQATIDRGVPAAPSVADLFAPAPIGSHFTEAQYYARIKPYDKKRGHVRLRQYCNELGRAIDGGTGLPGDIPEWVPVSREQAIALSQHRQRERDPNSPAVFDIVTEAQKRDIDQAETQYRAASLGLLGATPQAIIAQTKQLTARTLQPRQPQPALAQPARPNAPSLMEGAQVYQQAQQQLGQMTGTLQLGQMTGTLQPGQMTGALQPGRAAALADLGDPALAPADAPTATLPLPAPPPFSTPQTSTRAGVIEDMTALANGNRDVDEAIRTAAPHMQR